MDSLVHHSPLSDPRCYMSRGSAANPTKTAIQIYALLTTDHSGLASDLVGSAFGPWSQSRIRNPLVATPPASLTLRRCFDELSRIVAQFPGACSDQVSNFCVSWCKPGAGRSFKSLYCGPNLFPFANICINTILAG